MGTANNISFLYPSFPLLLEPDHVHDDLFCDGSTLGDKKCFKYQDKLVCRCIHRLKFKLGSIADLVVVNIDDKITHPMHLHGHKFHIMDTGLLLENLTVSEAKDAIPKTNCKKPPYKDTTILPYPGYTRLRFRADNPGRRSKNFIFKIKFPLHFQPGYWLFHCHFDWHLPIGMALMIQVGEVSEMRRAPDNFPRCFSYMPKGIV